MSKFIPLDDRLLVKRSEVVNKTASGIIIPETATDKPQDGIVIEAGPGLRDDNGNRMGMSVAQGDKIMFGRNAGIPITFEGEEYLILVESEVIAKIS